MPTLRGCLTWQELFHKDAPSFLIHKLCMFNIYFIATELNKLLKQNLRGVGGGELCSMKHEIFLIFGRQLFMTFTLETGIHLLKYNILSFR